MIKLDSRVSTGRSMIGVTSTRQSSVHWQVNDCG